MLFNILEIFIKTDFCKFLIGAIVFYGVNLLVKALYTGKKEDLPQ